MQENSIKKPAKTRHKSELSPIKARIYNQGFVLEPLPSVQRPSPNFLGLQPLSVRISAKNSSQIPAIYQSQPSFLHKSLSQFPKKINFKEIPEEKRETQEKFEKTCNLRRNSKALAPLPLPGLNNIAETAFLSNSSSDFLKSFANNLNKTSVFLQEMRKKGPSFELEARQSRYLLEKMTGKLRKPAEIAIDFPEESLRNAQDSLPKSEPFEKLAPKPRVSQQFDTYSRRSASKVDKYIELIMRNVLNLDEFIYLIRDSSCEDPYNLDVIEYETLKLQQIRTYYTISKKGLCLYENGKPCDFTALAAWLKERDTYDRIKSLKFFKKFRAWKTLKMWKRNIVRHKRLKHQETLENHLFFLNSRFRAALFAHRHGCVEMEKLRFIEFSQQKYGFSAEVPRLDEFLEQQGRKREAVREKLREFSAKCRENVRNCFQECLDALRSNHQREDRDVFLEQELRKRKENSGDYEKLGFEDELSYDKRSELRRECSKFLRFSYLVDFIALDSLRNIYSLTVTDLLEELSSLTKIKENAVFREKAQKSSGKYKEPLFFLTLQGRFDAKIEENSVFSQETREFIPPPLGTSEPQEFSLLLHLRLRGEKPAKTLSRPAFSQKNASDSENCLDSSDLEEEQEVYDESQTFQRSVCPTLYKQWLRLSPSPEEFLLGVEKSVRAGLDALTAFERWSRHEDISQYVNILEEWDDLADENWEMSESLYLDPRENMDSESVERDFFRVREVLGSAFERTDKYLASFNEFLQIFWENARVDVQIFRNRNLAHEVDALQNSLALLNYQKEFLENSIPVQADLGLFRVDSSEIREFLLPSPELLFRKLQVLLPEEVRIRGKELKEWLVNSTSLMKQGMNNLEEFVRLRDSVKRVEYEFPRVKKKLETLNQEAMILKDFRIELKKDDENLLVDVNHLAINLGVSMNNLLEALEKGMESNALKISKQLIPELEKAINELDYLVIL